LADHGLIRVSGPDAVSFLHNLLTNDITHLPPDGVRHAGFCTPKGRLIATFTIWQEKNLDGSADYLLLLSADILPGILKKLSMYVLRSKVKLVDISAERSLLGVVGSDAEALIGTLGLMTSLSFAGGTALRLDARRFILALPEDNAPTVSCRLAETARAGSAADWHLAEIEAGMPRIVTATQEAFTPQMVNYELPAVGGVSFQKGCYPGQEIVARTQYLGKVKRRMYRVALDSAFAPGTDVFTPEAGEQHCGAIVLCAPAAEGGFQALLVVQTSGMEANVVHVGAPDGPCARLLPQPYTVD
jgi:hypothetical protein